MPAVVRGFAYGAACAVVAAITCRILGVGPDPVNVWALMSAGYLLGSVDA